MYKIKSFLVIKLQAWFGVIKFKYTFYVYLF